MMISSVLVCVFFLVCLANVHAQTEGDSEGYDDLYEQKLDRLDRLFTLIDANEDQELAQSELESWISSFRGKAKERYLKVELAKISKYQGPHVSVEEYLSFDAEGKPISHAELKTRRRDFESSDANKDGFIAGDELAVLIVKAKQAALDEAAARQKIEIGSPRRYTFEDFLKSQAGKSTAAEEEAAEGEHSKQTDAVDLSEESVEQLKAVYYQTDLNKDGVLEPEEIQAVMNMQEANRALQEYSHQKIEKLASSLIDAVGNHRKTISHKQFMAEGAYVFLSPVLADGGNLLSHPEEYTSLHYYMDPDSFPSAEDDETNAEL